MPFGVVSGVGRGMDILDGVVIIKGEVAVLGVRDEHKCRTSHCNQWGQRCALPKLLWGGLVTITVVAFYNTVQLVGHLSLLSSAFHAS